MKELIRKTLIGALTLVLSSFFLLYELVGFARTYGRYWLVLMFALPLMILSSSTASTIWVIIFLVNRDWVPGSGWIKDKLANALVSTYTFGHGSWLKLFGLVIFVYVFLPVPAPALAYLARDMEGFTDWLQEEIFAGGPTIHPAMLDWTKLLFFILGYRQIVNFLSETEAWNGIVTGSSVFTPKMMRVVIHFQVLYTIALISYIHAQWQKVGIDTDSAFRRREAEAFFREMRDGYMQYRKDAGMEGMRDSDYNRESGPRPKPPRPTSKRKRRSKMGPTAE